MLKELWLEGKILYAYLYVKLTHMLVAIRWDSL